MGFFTQTDTDPDDLTNLMLFVRARALFELPSSEFGMLPSIPLSRDFEPIRRIYQNDIHRFYAYLVSALRQAQRSVTHQPLTMMQQTNMHTVLRLLEKVAPRVSALARGALVYKDNMGVCDTLEFDKQVFQFVCLLLDPHASEPGERTAQLEHLALNMQAFVQKPGALYAFKIPRALLVGVLLTLVTGMLYCLNQDASSALLYIGLSVCTGAFSYLINAELRERQAVAEFRSGVFLKAVRELVAAPNGLTQTVDTAPIGHKNVAPAYQ